MKLQPHDKVLIGGELVEIGSEIADAFVDGDRLIATTLRSIVNGCSLYPPRPRVAWKSCRSDMSGVLCSGVLG